MRQITFVATMLAMTLFFALILFVPAGRLDWPFAWVYIATVVTYIGALWLLLERHNPELIDRRRRIGKGTKTWDKVWLAVFAPVMYGVYIVAGLEARLGEPGLPVSLWPMGFALFGGGCALLTWSMLVNPFFEKTVRIQTDHGHKVIESGPYAIVRHPGYLGLFGWMLGTPLMLASAWSFVPAALAIAGIVIRTGMEDRTLNDELEGYAAYASRVPYRLIPRIW